MFDNLQRAIGLYLKDLRVPIAETAVSLLESGDREGLINLSISPGEFSDPDTYFRSAAAVALFKKLQGFGDKATTRQAALDKWYQGEKDCYRTNQRLQRYSREFRCNSDVDEIVGECLSEIRQIVYGLIGSGPDLDTVLAEGRFGPGATYSDRGRLTTVPDKMSSAPTLTRSAYWYLLGFAGTSWSDALASRNVDIQYVEGNRYSTVPKTSKTDRSIGSEPSINIFYQLAVGSLLRKALRRNTGWNLDTAQEVHKFVARKASRDKSYSTLDLSNASDTVSRVLVELLIPHAWYEHLLALRSPKTFVDGKWVVLEKFSSMGNGYTFELETVIFAAIAMWATRKCGHHGKLGLDVFVFGDDIIVPDGVESVLFPVLKFLGFTTNVDKTFWGQVPFRESCGGDYWNGLDVRPFFLKKIPNEPQDIISLANGLRSNLEKHSLHGEALSFRAWFATIDQLPKYIRECRGPKDLGDIVIHDEVNRWHTKSLDGIRYLRCYRPVKTRKVKLGWFHPDVVLASALYGVSNSGKRGNDGNIIPRDAVRSYGLKWIPFS